MRYIVRYSKDYSVFVDAESDIDAIKKAEKIPEDEWGVETSELDADEENPPLYKSLMGGW